LNKKKWPGAILRSYLFLQDSAAYKYGPHIAGRNRPKRPILAYRCFRGDFIWTIISLMRHLISQTAHYNGRLLRILFQCDAVWREETVEMCDMAVIRQTPFSVQVNGASGL
jgi:hypothetical protein